MTQEAQLKACPNAEAIAQQIADRTRWKKSTDTYARIYQAAYAAAILTEQTRIESGVVAEALLAVVNATRAYLPPDGISEQECINRILEATDNPKINPVIAAWEASK